jgi:UDP-glucose 4-epimerase
VAPLAPYGWNKLEQEELARRFGLETATPVMIGRLSNLYGPGQNLNKVQGLISQMCLRVLTRQPLVLYVPLDTIRDYLFAKDAGRLVADCLDRLRAEAAAGLGRAPVMKILASQQTATVASVLAQLRWITKRPVSVIVAASPDTNLQARDLRMASSIWRELDRQPVTTLSEGIRSVLTGILAMAGRGPLELEALGGR